MADDENDEGGEPRRSFDIEGALNSLIARNHNDPRTALRTLSEDNYQYRRTIRKLKEQVKELEKRPVLKEGDVIVNAERAKTLKDFEALKVKVEDVQNGLSERDKLKAKEAERKQSENIARGAKPLRLNSEVLTDLIKTRSLQHELREVEVEDKDGKKVTASVLHLRKSDDDQWSPADKFAEKELKGYLPALRLDGDDDSSEESEDDEAADTNREDEDEPRRRPFPRQASGTGSKALRTSTDVVDNHIRARYTPPSKLRQKQDT